VPAKRLNEQVRRNRERFPTDFCFQLKQQEWTDIEALRSQNATLKKGRGRHRKYAPYVFTEHGAIMAATVLNSDRAVQMSLFVVRAFVKMRQAMTANKILLAKLQELEARLTTRLDSHEQAIVYVLNELRKLMEPPQLPEPKRRPIGFGREEE
jgi:phage regulator Rha-like protein